MIERPCPDFSVKERSAGAGLAFSPCGRRWPSQRGRMRGAGRNETRQGSAQADVPDRKAALRPAPLIRRLRRHLLPQGRGGAGRQGKVGVAEAPAPALPSPPVGEGGRAERGRMRGAGRNETRQGGAQADVPDRKAALRPAPLIRRLRRHLLPQGEKEPPRLSREGRRRGSAGAGLDITARRRSASGPCRKRGRKGRSHPG